MSWIDRRYPGVYVEELPNVPTIVGVPTSTTAFVGTSSSGVVGNVERLQSSQDAQQRLGDLSTAMGLGIRQFFLNGGQECLAIPNVTDNANRVAAFADAIAALDKLDPFNLLCIPEMADLDPATTTQVIEIATGFCERRRAFLLVDAPQLLKTPRDVSNWLDGNASLRHCNAALYYPRVKVRDAAGAEHMSAPSGTMAGVIARTDMTREVWRAPAGNEATLKETTGLESLLSTSENEFLNQRGVNCLREFPGIGRVCWGARTLSLDPDWKYVAVRRLLLHLEASIDKGLEWAVFEPNDEPLWARVRQCVGSFLMTLWRRGAFQGATPKDAFFVKCDQGTMSQNDIDTGRLVGEIGVAALTPAEFVIFRIGQWTASRK